MLESLKKKTLLGNLWCIIVLGIVTAALGVVFGPGIVKMLAGPAYFEPLDDHEDMKLFVVGEYGRRFFTQHRIPIERMFRRYPDRLLRRNRQQRERQAR